MKKFGDFITEIKASERKIPRLDTGLSILDAIIDEDGKLVDETGYIRNVKRNGEMRQVIVDKSWDDNNYAQWVEHAKRSRVMFEEAGVKLKFWEGELLDIHRFRSGKKF